MSKGPAVIASVADEAVNRRAVFINGAVLAGLLLTRPDRTLTRVLQHLDISLSDNTSTAASPFVLTTFAPYVGSTFRASASDSVEVPLRLVEATRSPIRAADMDRLEGEAFSLIFEGSTATRMSSSQRTITHTAAGSHSVFLSPIGRGLVVQDYQAVFDFRTVRGSTTSRKSE